MSSALPSRLALTKAITERKPSLGLPSKKNAVPVVKKRLPKKAKKASRVQDASSDNAKLDDILNALTALRSEHHALAGRAREKLHHALAEVCAGAHRLKSSARLFRAFCEHEFWDENPKARPRPEDRDRATRFLFRWYCGPGDAASKRASFYATQVQDLDLGPEPGPWFDMFNSRGGITKIREMIVLPERSESISKKVASPTSKRSSSTSRASTTEKPSAIEEPAATKMNTIVLHLEPGDDVNFYAVDTRFSVFLKLESLVHGKVNTAKLVFIGTAPEQSL